MSEQQAAVEQTPAPQDETAAMEAVWDRLHADDAPEDEQTSSDNEEGAAEDKGAKPEAEKNKDIDEAASEEASSDNEDGADEEPEAEAEEPETKAAEAPQDLPQAIREKWASMDPAVQEAVVSTQRELSRKLSDQGRIVQAVKPTYDVLLEAAKADPSIANMKPGEMAESALQWHKFGQKFAQNPVQTILETAHQYGALDALVQAIGGQQPDQSARQSMEMAQEIRELRRQLQSVTDPSAIDQRIEQTLTSRDTERLIAEYAKGQEYWGAVEADLPKFIPIAQDRLSESASPQDVLSAAYDMAIHANPELRAKVTAAARKAPAKPSPEQTEAQRKAKSVNVGSRSTGKPQQMTERQRMEAVWTRMQNE